MIQARFCRDLRWPWVLNDGSWPSFEHSVGLKLVRLIALLDPEASCGSVETVHRGSSVVDGRKHRLHTLREPERRLRERLQAIEFVARQPHIDRLQVVFELCKPPRADDSRG